MILKVNSTNTASVTLGVEVIEEADYFTYLGCVVDTQGEHIVWAQRGIRRIRPRSPTSLQTPKTAWGSEHSPFLKLQLNGRTWAKTVIFDTAHLEHIGWFSK